MCKKSADLLIWKKQKNCKFLNHMSNFKLPSDRKQIMVIKLRKTQRLCLLIGSGDNA